MSFLRRALEQRDITSLAPPTMAAMGLTVPSNLETNSGVLGGIPVTDSSALQLTAFYAGVRLLADTIASLPWDAFRKGPSTRVEVAQPSLLRSPHPDMTDFDWKHMMVVSLVMRGNFFGVVVERDPLGYPTTIAPLHPDQVRLERDATTFEKKLWIGGQRRDLADLFHIRAFTLPGCDVGLSPISMARHALGLGLEAQEYGEKWFRDGASPSSVLETDSDLSDDQVKRVQRSWISSHGGRRRPAVLSGGFKWKPITITPEESQFLQTRKFQVTEIARMLGIPPHMIGDVDSSSSWGTGIEQQSIGFVTYTLRPWLTRIEAAMTNALPRGQFVKFNVDALLRGDTKSRYEAYTMAVNGGWANPDEIRALEDLAPIPGGAGEKYRQPLNFGPLGAEPPPKAAPTTAPPQGDPSGDNGDNAA